MFQLTSGATTYDFAIDGSVQQAGAAFGTWTTDANNQIVLTPGDGSAAIDLPVTWLFNNNNQLQIVSGGTTVFNFHAGGALPSYSNDKDTLIATPDSTAGFNFELHGTWDFNAQNLLTLTLGTQLSVLDGFLQDTTGQFSYHFFDLANLAGGNESVLIFAGNWNQSVVDGRNVLVLKYDTADGKEAEFTLPGTINLDPSVNEFAYTYDRGTDTFGLQFVGILHVASDFTIQYTLDESSSSTGNAVTFKMAANFVKTNFSGNLDLQLQSSTGTGTTFTIGGSFAAVLGGSTLDVGFHFTQPNSGNAQSFGFNGDFVSANGTDLSWQFDVNGPAASISLDVENFRIGNARVSDRFTLTAQNGQVVAITDLFGIQF